jgi:hypothetical protein
MLIAKFMSQPIETVEFDEALKTIKKPLKAEVPQSTRNNCLAW